MNIAPILAQNHHEGVTDGVVVWVWYDWRAAAVADADGEILDEESWDGYSSIESLVKRLERISQGLLTPEAEILSQRFPDATVLLHGDEQLPDADWPLPSPEAQECADVAALRMAERSVALSAGDPDRRLEHMLRACDELRASFVTVDSRLIEWVGMFLSQVRLEKMRSKVPKMVSESDTIEQLATPLGVEEQLVSPSETEWKILQDWAANVASSRSRLDKMEAGIREMAEEHLPSLSRLLGPQLAARLCVEAHGRMRLARLPSGTLQVLGAEKAFFNHLKTGAPPPKHGHIFMHPWISRSPRWIRGRISRMLAAKASIAVRSDAFGGAVWDDEMVADVAARVEEIRRQNPKPRR